MDVSAEDICSKGSKCNAAQTHACSKLNCLLAFESLPGEFTLPGILQARCARSSNIGETGVHDNTLLCLSGRAYST